jgi:hypothetical protein
MHRDARAAVLAALRKIFDGSWVRHVGVDGGRTLSWQGKVAVLAACTPTIDTHHAVMASMGERFLLYRLPKPSGQDLVKRALTHTGQETAMRQELAQAVAGLFAAVQLPTDPSQRSADDEARLIALASLAARCRSAVERNSYTREIELIPDPEVPARLALTLLRLLVGMRSLGVPEQEQWAVLIKVAKDCIPALRLRIVELLGAFQHPMKTSQIAVHVRYPSQTVRRALEDLTAHGIVIRQGKAHEKDTDLWAISDWTDKHFREGIGAFPETSRGEGED